MHNNNLGTFTIRLNNGRSVRPELLDEVRLAVEERTPMLTPGTTMTLREICGEELWGVLTDGVRRMAGWCMQHLVALGLVPYMEVETDHEYPKFYVLSNCR